MEQKGEVSLLALLSCRIYKNGGMVLVFIHRNTQMCNEVRVQHCARQVAGIIFTPNAFSVYCIQYPLYSQEDIFLEQERATLACRDGNASRDADAVVDDSEDVDVVFHACLQARDGAGGGIAWNPNL